MAETPKPKVAHGAIEVAAGKTSKGPAATNIRVQVDVQKLDQEVGEGTHTSSAFAFVPRTVDGKRAWSKEELHRLGKHLDQDERLKESFDATVQGPSESSEEGVAVALETTAGTVWAQEPGDTYGVRSMNEPDASTPKGHQVKVTASGAPASEEQEANETSK